MPNLPSRMTLKACGAKPAIAQWLLQEAREILESNGLRDEIRVCDIHIATVEIEQLRFETVAAPDTYSRAIA